MAGKTVPIFLFYLCIYLFAWSLALIQLRNAFLGVSSSLLCIPEKTIARRDKKHHGHLAGTCLKGSSVVPLGYNINLYILVTW